MTTHPISSGGMHSRTLIFKTYAGVPHRADSAALRSPFEETPRATLLVLVLACQREWPAYFALVGGPQGVHPSAQRQEWRRVPLDMRCGAPQLCPTATDNIKRVW